MPSSPCPASCAEVFIRLTASSKQVNAAVGGIGADVDNRLCVLCQKRPTELCTLTTKTGKDVQSADLVCAVCADGVDPSTYGAPVGLPGEGTEEAKGGEGGGLLADDATGVDGSPHGGLPAGRGSSSQDSSRPARSSTGSTSKRHASRFRQLLGALWHKEKQTYLGCCASREARRAHFRLPEEQRKKAGCGNVLCLSIIAPLLLLAGLLTVSLSSLPRNDTNPWPDAPHSTTGRRLRENPQDVIRKLKNGYTETCVDAAGEETWRWYQKAGAKKGFCDPFALAAFIEVQLNNCSRVSAASPFGCRDTHTWASVTAVKPRAAPLVWLGDENGSAQPSLPFANNTAAGGVSFTVLPPASSPGAQFVGSVEWVRDHTSPLSELLCDVEAAPGVDDDWNDDSWSLTAPTPSAAAAVFDQRVPDVGMTLTDTTVAANGAMSLALQVHAYMTADNSTADNYQILNVFSRPANVSLDVSLASPCARSWVASETTLHGQLALARLSVSAMLVKAQAGFSVGATWFRLPSPDYTWSERQAGSSTASVITVPIAFTALVLLVVPQLTYTLVSERETGLADVMRVQGVTPVATAVHTFLFYGTVSLVTTVLVVLPTCAILATLPTWGPFTWLVLALSCAGSLLAAPLSMLLSSVLSSGRNALLVTIALYLALLGAAAASAFVQWPWVVMLACPWLGLARGLALATGGNGGSDLVASVATFIAGGLVYGAAGVLVHAEKLTKASCSRAVRCACCRTPDRSAVSHGSGLPAVSLRTEEIHRSVSAEARRAEASARVRSLKRSAGSQASDLSTSTPSAQGTASGLSPDGLAVVLEDEDEDVVNERLAAAREGLNGSTDALRRHAIALVGLRKRYPARGGQPPVDAVKGVTLRCEYGECFGLYVCEGCACDCGVLLTVCW